MPNSRLEGTSHTLFQTKMVEIDTLFQTKTAKKNRFSAAHTYTAYVRDYPSGAKNTLQIMSLAAYASETKEGKYFRKLFVPAS